MRRGTCSGCNSGGAAAHACHVLGRPLPSDLETPKHSERADGCGVSAQLQHVLLSAHRSANNRAARCFARWFARDRIDRAARAIPAEAAARACKAVGIVDATFDDEDDSVRQIVACALLRLLVGVLTEERQESFPCRDPVGAYALAVWNDAHVAFLQRAASLARHRPRLLRVWLQRRTTLPFAASAESVPHLGTVALGRFFRPKYMRMLSPLAQLFVRSLQGNDRSWKRALTKILPASRYASAIIAQGLGVMLRGGHPYVSPSMRPSLAQRDRIRRHFSASSVLDAVKENGARFPHTLRVALQSLIRLDEARGGCSGSVLATVKRWTFDSMSGLASHVEPFDRTEGDTLRRLAAACCKTAISLGDASTPEMHVRAEEHMRQSCLAFEGGRVAAFRQHGESAVEVGEAIFLHSHAASFVPLWRACQDAGLQLSRLTQSMHAALRATTAACRACQEASKDDMLRAQRLAFVDPSAATRSVADVLHRLGRRVVSHPVAVASFDQMQLSASQSVRLAQRIATRDQLGPFLHYCRVAKAKEMLLCMHLPPLALERQRRARLSAGMPAPKLVVCTCCRQISSCLSKASVRPGSSSVGVRCAMVDQQDRLLCARRGSAIDRSATARAYASSLASEEAWGDDGFAAVWGGSSREATGELKASTYAMCMRDARLTMQQCTSRRACGSVPMLSFPLEGRIIRIDGKWFSCCARCGCAMHVSPSSCVVGSEFCCFACPDLRKQPTRKRSLVAKSTDGERTFLEVCRACGKALRPTCRSTAVLFSPLDDSPENASLPRSLRYTSWCRAHHRQWLAAALRTWPTSSILSHIDRNAVPVSFAKELLAGERRVCLRSCEDDGPSEADSDDDGGEGGGEGSGEESDDGSGEARKVARKSKRARAARGCERRT